MSFPSGDNRTVWQLAFNEEGLDPIVKKASVAEKQFDRIVASAVKAGAAMGTFGSSSVLQPMSNAEMRAKNFSLQIEQSGKSLEQFKTYGGAALQAFAGVATVAFGAMALGAAAAGAALSKLDEHATKAFGERTSTIRAYTTILGDAKQAQIEYSKANELASKTELTSASTLKAQQSLIVAGFRGADLTNALAASVDVAATKQPEERELTMERMGRAFSQILAAGKLRGQELNQLAEAGVNRGQVLELLGKGDSGKGEKLISAGGVSAQAGIAAVQQSILQTLGTKRLGEFATGASGSLAGELSNRSESLDLLLKSFDGEALPAVERFKSALHEQNAALTTGSDTGKGLVMMLSDFASITANVKTIWTDFSTSFLETFVESYNVSREATGAYVTSTHGIKDLGAALGKIGSVVGGVADGFEGLMAVLSPLGKWLGSTITNLVDTFSALKDGRVRDAQIASSRLFGFMPEEEDAKGGKVDESSWEAFKSRQAAQKTKNELQWGAFKEVGTAGLADGKSAPSKAVTTKWGKGSGGGKASGGGYDITGLLMNGGGRSSSESGEGNSASQGLAGRFQAAVGAAAAVSSAPSARAQQDAAMGVSNGGMCAASVTIAAGAIVVNGVSDPVMAANEVYRLLGQTLGRVTRAPGAGVF